MAAFIAFLFGQLLLVAALVAVVIWMGSARAKIGVAAPRGDTDANFGVPLIALGLMAICSYVGLRLAHVAKIGEPTDIGGGFILPVGLVLFATGAAILGSQDSTKGK